MNRPTTGDVEARTATVEVEAKRIRGLIPYGVESRDLGGWREVIEPGAFASTKIEELRAVVDHAGVPLGRWPATLDVEDSADGLRWSVDPPTSRADVVEAIERGDMQAGSWRMKVARDRFDVAIVGAELPAYPDAAVEYRSTSQSTDGERRQKGASMDPQETGAASAENTETNTENTETTETTATVPAPAEQRSAPAEQPAAAGSLRVEQRTSGPQGRGLADEFRAAGFPGEAAEIPWEAYESRAVTWSPSVNLLGQISREAGAFPFDQRYAWTALDRESVDSGVTSVVVFTQTATSAATGVVRDIDAVTPKAEVGSTLDLDTVPLKGVAAVQSDIPSVYLEQPSVDRVIERDLTMAVNDGIDEIVCATFADSDNEPVGSNAIIGIRKSMTTLFAAGYNPDLVILDPTTAEELDLLVTGISGGTADFVFPAGQFSPELFNLRRVIAKGVDDPVVLDSRAYGQLYVSPAQLTQHEQDGGLTNKVRVRLELNAALAVERQDAAIRVASS